MKIRVLSFDFEGTIVKFENIDWFWREHIPSLYSKKTGICLADAKTIIYRDYNEVGPDRPEWYIPLYWFKKYGLEEEYIPSMHELCKKIRLMDDVKELKIPEGIELIICSAMWEDIIRMYLNKTELAGRVIRVFTPPSFGLARKNEMFYMKVAKSLGLENGSQILHAGDNPEYDYRAPIKAGWKAVLIDRKDSSIKSFERGAQDDIVKVNSLKEILKHIS